jgi:hypothetical protein
VGAWECASTGGQIGNCDWPPARERPGFERETTRESVVPGLGLGRLGDESRRLGNTQRTPAYDSGKTRFVGAGILAIEGSPAKRR